MSNYPAGVTGNEPEIAGLPEFELFRECDNTDAMWVPMNVITTHLYWVSLEVTKMQRLNPLIPPNRSILDRVVRLLGELTETARKEETEFACDWSGKTDVQSTGGTVIWECPRCGVEHEEEWEPEGPDPDRDYDNRE